MTPAAHSTPTLDRDEVARFAKLGGEWWDANGPFKPLHRINPTRLTYIRDQLVRAFKRNAKEAKSLEALSVLDIGCGGGLVCEPLARLGARVTGIDPGEEAITAAKAHAAAGGLDINYQVATAEELAARAPNMRAPEICPRGRSPVRVVVALDGRVLLDATLAPSGLARDGTSSLYRRLPIPAGEHRLTVRVIDDLRRPAHAFELSATLNLVPGRVLSVDFKPARGCIVLS